MADSRDNSTPYDDLTIATRANQHDTDQALHLQAELQAALATLDGLQQELDARTAERERMRQELQDAKEHALANPPVSSAGADSDGHERKAMQARLDALDAKAGALRKERSQARSKATRVAKENVVLKEQLASMQPADNDSELDSLREERNELQRRLDEANAYIAGLETTPPEAIPPNDAASDEVGALRERLQATQAEAADWKARFDDVDAEADELERTVIALEDELEQRPTNAEPVEAADDVQFQSIKPEKLTRAERKDKALTAVAAERKRLEKRHRQELADLDVVQKKFLQALEKGHADDRRALERQMNGLKRDLRREGERIAELKQELHAVREELKDAYDAQERIIEQAAKDVADAYLGAERDARIAKSRTKAKEAVRIARPRTEPQPAQDAKAEPMRRRTRRASTRQAAEDHIWG